MNQNYKEWLNKVGEDEKAQKMAKSIKEFIIKEVFDKNN